MMALMIEIIENAVKFIQKATDKAAASLLLASQCPFIEEIKVKKLKINVFFFVKKITFESVVTTSGKSSFFFKEKW